VIYLRAGAYPQGTRSATFDLNWFRDWSRFPTSDIDMLVYDPDGNLVSMAGPR
jgi:hypothetical protein